MICFLDAKTVQNSYIILLLTFGMIRDSDRMEPKTKGGMPNGTSGGRVYYTTTKGEQIAVLKHAPPDLKAMTIVHRGERTVYDRDESMAGVWVKRLAPGNTEQPEPNGKLLRGK